MALALGLMFWGCSDQNQDAAKMLERAGEMVKHDSLASAKLMIDSARRVYPKAYESIRQGIQLMRHIERMEFDRTLAYCDSMLPARNAELLPLLKDFVFEKDSEYQEIGNFVHRLQKLEQNVERSYVRSHVDEKGNLVLASVYFGKTPIEHVAMRLELPDGQFAETQTIAYDGGNNYRFEDNGNWTEVVSYKDEKDNGAVDLICANPTGRIKVKLTGKKPSVFYLDEQAKKAIAASRNISIILSDMERLKKEQVRARKGIEVLTKRIAEKTQSLD